MNAGDVVRYAHLSDAECLACRDLQATGVDKHFTFTVLELRGDRVLIESRDFPTWRFAPTEVVALTDVEVVK